VTSILEDLAALGPFFAVEAHRPEAAAATPWQPLLELVRDERVLRERVSSIRQRLAAGGGQPEDAVELRVAASVTHLGIVARLISPVLATAVHAGVVLDLDLARTWWEPVIGGAVPLSITFPQPGESEEDADRLADAIAHRLLDGPIRQIGTVAARFSLSGKVLWGNVASAVHGAATMLITRHPDRAPRVHALTAGLRDRAPLLGTGTMSADGQFRRRSCCLIYRAAPGAAGPVCGDCVLTENSVSATVVAPSRRADDPRRRRAPVR
jgi:hypothetical protein